MFGSDEDDCKEEIHNESSNNLQSSLNHELFNENIEELSDTGEEMNRNTDDKTATLCETKKNHYTFSRRRRTNTQFKSTGRKKDNTAVNEDHDYFNPFEEYERNTQDKDFIASQSTGVVKKKPIKKRNVGYEVEDDSSLDADGYEDYTISEYEHENINDSDSDSKQSIYEPVIKFQRCCD